MGRALLSHILPLALLPALAACGGGKESPPPVPPPSAEAMKAVVKDAPVSREKLARAVDALFTDPAVEETRAVVVMQGGRIVAERYAPGYHENTRFVSWSMAKSVTGVMIGLLISDGRL